MQVKINFLMVGHTHEVIDQVFSRLGVEITNSNLLTFDGMLLLPVHLSLKHWCFEKLLIAAHH